MTQRFFDYMKDKHGLTLLQTEMAGIMLEAAIADRETRERVAQQQEQETVSSEQNPEQNGN